MVYLSGGFCPNERPPASPFEFPEGSPIQQGQPDPENASSAFHLSQAML
jgi:hypothetical protein